MEQDLIEFTRSICLPSGIDLTRYLINYINQNAKLYDLMIRNKTKFTVSVESYDSYGIVYVLTNLDLDNFNTSEVTNMHGMFDTCKKIEKNRILTFVNVNYKIITIEKF